MGKPKFPSKSNARGKCAASKNVVDTKNDGKCDRVEHFDCINANDFVIESIQKGLTNYYCTECLCLVMKLSWRMKYPQLE